jgi:hypothetical protein
LLSELFHSYHLNSHWLCLLHCSSLWRRDSSPFFWFIDFCIKICLFNAFSKFCHFVQITYKLHIYKHHFQEKMAYHWNVLVHWFYAMYNCSYDFWCLSLIFCRPMYEAWLKSFNGFLVKFKCSQGKYTLTWSNDVYKNHSVFLIYARMLHL